MATGVLPAGTYYVKVSRSDNCTTPLATYTFSVIPQPGVGIPAVNEDIPIRLYPNPAKDIVYLESPQPVERATVYHINGQVLLQSEKVDRMDVSSLQPGMYLIKLITSEGEVVQKLIKE